MSEAQKEAREALIEQATWALIDFDTDVADRGVSDEHYRERRADVERVFPILASRAPQPTEDERRIPGFAERERGAQAAWEFFARDDRDVSRDFRAGYHQGTIDEARRRAPQPTDDDPLNVERENAAAEYTRRNVGGMQPVMTVGERVHDAFVTGAEWAAGFRRAPGEPARELAMSPEHVKETAESLHFPAEPAVQVEPTDAQVLVALNAFAPCLAEDSLDMWAEGNVLPMRAALRAALATRGTDDDR